MRRTPLFPSLICFNCLFLYFLFVRRWFAHLFPLDISPFSSRISIYRCFWWNNWSFSFLHTLKQCCQIIITIISRRTRTRRINFNKYAWLIYYMNHLSVVVLGGYMNQWNSFCATDYYSPPMAPTLLHQGDFILQAGVEVLVRSMSGQIQPRLYHPRIRIL